MNRRWAIPETGHGAVGIDVVVGVPLHGVAKTRWRGTWVQSAVSHD